LRYRRLGRSGLEVSVIGLGTNNFGARDQFPFNRGPETATPVIHRALDLGINLIDTANSYGPFTSEEYIGLALKGRRHEAVLATKVHSRVGDGPNMGGSSRKHIMDQVEGSLRRLGTDYIDLYQLHGKDTATPVDETMRALDDLVRQGKVRYIGCSNFRAWHTCDAIWTSRSLGLSEIVSVQPPYSMLQRDVEAELLPFCQQYGVGILPYYPLAQGFLTGKYRRGETPPEGSRLVVTDRGEWMLTERNFDILEGLERFSEERGHTVLELAFAWLLAKPPVSSVIAGATTPAQIEGNAASGEWDLDEDEMQELDRILGQ
jgi:aryl-alcohol dehydrogenase-like predicted oxidoreductase